jgi:hypothetical protein
VPLSDLALATDTTPLRLAVVVNLRAPNRLSAAPPGGLMRGPSEFAQVKPPAGGWASAGVASPDLAAFAKEDAADEVRLGAWRRFVDAQRSGAVSVQEARAKLLAPLDGDARPGPTSRPCRCCGPASCASSTTSRAPARLFADAPRGPVPPEARGARRARHQVLAARPERALGTTGGLRESRRAKTEAPRAGRPGRRGILRYRHGDFARSVELLDALVARYPVDEETAGIHRFARLYGPLWPEEEGFRKADAAKDDLPRVRLVTSRGAVLLELFEDQVPNTVRNFLWLTAAKLYDGTTFHRVEPFFMCQGGYLPSNRDLREGQGARH